MHPGLQETQRNVSVLPLFTSFFCLFREEEECRTPSPATECFPLEQVVTVREIIAPQSISSPAIVSADEVEPKFHDVSKELEKSATDLENQALGDKESKDESTM